jgi:hypothetical protein
VVHQRIGQDMLTVVGDTSRIAGNCKWGRGRFDRLSAISNELASNWSLFAVLPQLAASVSHQILRHPHVIHVKVRIEALPHQHQLETVLQTGSGGVGL